MTVLCPASGKELADMLRWAVEEATGPVAIRYPRGGDCDYHDSAWRGEVSTVYAHRTGGTTAFVTYGSLFQNAMDAAKILEIKGIASTVVRLLSLSSLSSSELLDVLSGCDRVVILEECLDHCGIHGELTAVIHTNYPGLRVDVINLGSQYITHGSVADLYRASGLDAESIANHILEVHHSEN